VRAAACVSGARAIEEVQVIGYVIAGLLIVSATVAVIGAVTGTAVLYWSGIAVAAVTTGAVCVGVARAARDA